MRNSSNFLPIHLKPDKNWVNNPFTSYTKIIIMPHALFWSFGGWEDLKVFIIHYYSELILFGTEWYFASVR
jgi:hypothetical protein